MNKKVLTLCAGALLAGGVSLAYVAPVNAALPAITAVTATQTEAPTFEANKVTELTGDYEVADNGTLTIDKEGATLDGKGYTLTGHLVITANNVTVKNLNITSVTTGSTRYTKTAITVGEDTQNKGEVELTGIVIDNVKITCKANTGEGYLANGISINTSAKDATCKITNSTITSSNSVGDGWYSVGIIVNAPNSAISAADFFTEESNNKFNDAVVAAVQYAEGSGYDYANLIPDADNATNNGLDKYIVSVLNKIKNDGTLAVDADAKDVLAALVKATAEEGTSVSEDAKVAVVANDQNLLFGDATAPDNKKESSVVLVSDDGSVSAEAAAASKSITLEGVTYNVVEAAPANDADEYYYLILHDEKGDDYIITADENGAATATNVNSVVADTDENNNALWKMTHTTSNGVAQYFFVNKAGITLKTTGDAVTGKDGWFSALNGTSYDGGVAVKLSGASLNGSKPAYIALYETAEKAYTVDQLKSIEGSGFSLTIKDNTGKNDQLEGNVFDGTLVPVEVAGGYQLMSGDKYVVLDTDAKWSGNGIVPSGLGYKFTTISQETLTNPANADRYESVFNIYYRVGDNTREDLTPTEATKISYMTVGDYYLATFNVTDKESKDYLTVNNKGERPDLQAVISFGSNDRVDVHDFLTGQFVNIAFANKHYKENASGQVIADEKYKMGGVLAIAADIKGTAEAEYVAAAKTDPSYPESQWAVKFVEDEMNAKGKVTFVNRENPEVKVENVILYNTGIKDVYAVTTSENSNVIAKDTVKISFIKNVGMFDGYKYVEAAGLQDTIYNIAAYKAVNNVNDAYWVEKGHSSTHQVGLDGNVENAGEWNLRLATKDKLDANGDVIKDANGNNVQVIDTVFVKSTLQTWDSSKQTIKDVESVLAIFPYAIQNAGNYEYITYNSDKNYEYYVCNKNLDENTVADKNAADHFALKIQPNGTFHIVTLGKATQDYAWDGENAIVMGDKVFAGNAANEGTLDHITNYSTTFNDLMTVTPVAMPEYRPVIKANESAFDTVRIYRDENHSQLLYEKKDQKSGISFLNIDNENQFKLADAIFVDTAYVHRGNNTRWQYLLAVEPNNVSEWYCPYNDEHNSDAWREANGGHCADAVQKNYVEGRFLINLMDTANVYETTIQHENPYVNEVEANEMLAKLAFVPGKHFGDTLVIYADEAMTQVKDSLYLGTPDFNIAKFAFRYHDNAAQSFKIQTQWKNWKDGDLRIPTETSNDGYLRWVNGCVVVTNTYKNGDVFNMTESYEGNPTANEEISAENGAVSVVATEGGVIVKGAAGKNVVIATILGKIVANETINSDNETIAVPAGIAVVSVDGESFKVVVK